MDGFCQSRDVKSYVSSCVYPLMFVMKAQDEDVRQRRTTGASLRAFWRLGRGRQIALAPLARNGIVVRYAHCTL